MNLEMSPMDPELERAIEEIRGDEPDPAAVEAAAARVWARLAEDREHPAAGPIRGCEDIRALLPDYRAGRLPEARAMLVKDHLHQCVACRRAYEGKLVVFPRFRPGQPAMNRSKRVVWLAAAAVVVAGAGVTLWMVRDRFAPQPARAYVQAVNGSLYQITAAGVLPLAVGQDLPEGVEIRTAKDSGAVVQLLDGSTLELRERSSFTASRSGGDITVRLARGSAIVQAAKRRTGHLYVDTGDCRAAVTGTVFSVNAGVKGSRISVIQGEVHVTQDNREKVLRPGDQTSTSTALEPGPAQDDFQWSHAPRPAGNQAIGSSRRRAQRVAAERPAPGIRHRDDRGRRAGHAGCAALSTAGRPESAIARVGPGRRCGIGD